VEATAGQPTFPNIYPNVKFEHVTLNGAPLTAAAQTSPATTPLKPD
jgi:hypothetical protein